MLGMNEMKFWTKVVLSKVGHLRQSLRDGDQKGILDTWAQMRPGQLAHFSQSDLFPFLSSLSLLLSLLFIFFLFLQIGQTSMPQPEHLLATSAKHQRLLPIETQPYRSLAAHSLVLTTKALSLSLLPFIFLLFLQIGQTSMPPLEHLRVTSISHLRSMPP